MFFCWNVGDTGMFDNKMNFFAVLWIVTAYNQLTMSPFVNKPRHVPVCIGMKRSHKTIVTYNENVLITLGVNRTKLCFSICSCFLFLLLVLVSCSCCSAFSLCKIRKLCHYYEMAGLIIEKLYKEKSLVRLTPGNLFW